MTKPERQAALRNIWQARNIPVIAFLSSMRDQVLARDTKKMPKWKFRLADDLALQIQPRRFGFAAMGVLCANVTEEDIAATSTARHQSRKLGRPIDIIRFDIVMTNDRGCWRLQARSVPAGMEVADVHAFYDRVEHALSNGYFEHIGPGQLLRPSCFICGRRLTDPESMERMIGPECSARLDVDFV